MTENYTGVPAIPAQTPRSDGGKRLLSRYSGRHLGATVTRLVLHKQLSVLGGFTERWVLGTVNH